MSTGADCRFIEAEPGRWRYELQEWPYGETEQYERSPLFRSYRAASEDLHSSHANPGGHSITLHPQHVHEWTTVEGGQVPAGFIVSIRIHSLGPDATPAELVAKLATIPADNPAWSFKPTFVYDARVRSSECDACGATKS